MKTEISTPRTDAHLALVRDVYYRDCLLPQFGRELERENIALTAALRQCVEALEKVQQVPPFNLGLGVINSVRAALAAAREARR